MSSQLLASKKALCQSISLSILRMSLSFKSKTRFAANWLKMRTLEFRRFNVPERQLRQHDSRIIYFIRHRVHRERRAMFLIPYTRR